MKEKLRGKRCQTGFLFSYFTLVELLITIAIIAILAALLLPALQGAVEKSRTIACVSNQKQIGIGIAAYVADFNDWLPDANQSYRWAGQIGRYMGLKNANLTPGVEDIVGVFCFPKGRRNAMMCPSQIIPDNPDFRYWGPHYAVTARYSSSSWNFPKTKDGGFTWAKNTTDPKQFSQVKGSTVLVLEGNLPKECDEWNWTKTLAASTSSFYIDNDGFPTSGSSPAKFLHQYRMNFLMKEGNVVTKQYAPDLFKADWSFRK